jgi:hypothetical protein
MEVGVQFVVAGADIWVNIGSTAQRIYVGSYVWNLAGGSYTAYSLTAAATVWICAGTGATATATVTATATTAPTWTPGPVDIPTAYCVPIDATATVINYSMPNLALIVPARPTAPGITTTAQISITAIIAFQATIRAGISTPAAAARTASAGYSWQAGAAAAATSGVVIQPGLNWIAILNPQNPAWGTEGGPLWAVQPGLGPILPIVGFFILVAIGRGLLWILQWFLKLIDLVIKLIELIPGQ